ncbi:UBX domain-containing protein 10 [Anolis sagrei]|uniref:UBX domain-containing protein 10 n=1 Tax=Anolis sagrei TaxID=38937 RepID=UPI0035200A3F
MAAASQLNAVPSGKKPPFVVVNPPRLLTTHVTRPKSAKGRTRPLLTCSYGASSSVPPSPGSHAEEPLQGGQRVSTPQVFPAEVPDLLQQVPLRSSSSLNKYRVLPSISRKGLRNSGPEGAPDHTTSVRMEKKGDCAWRVQGSGKERDAEEEPEEPGEGEPRLLLAIRSPSGQRFERHFRPSDSLQAVLAVAARRNSSTYRGRGYSLETAEVPRRTFSDLSRSLEECGIPHKSVLCILRREEP